MDCKKEESGGFEQSTWQNGGPCPEMKPISCLLLAHIPLERPSHIPVGMLRAPWGVGDVSLGPGERSRLRTYWRHHCGRGRDGGRWWQRPMKSLPRLSLPRGCAPEKSQTVPSGAHPPSPGSHCPPPPTFSLFTLLFFFSTSAHPTQTSPPPPPVALPLWIGRAL